MPVDDDERETLAKRLGDELEVRWKHLWSSAWSSQGEVIVEDVFLYHPKAALFEVFRLEEHSMTTLIHWQRDAYPAGTPVLPNDI